MPLEKIDDLVSRGWLAEVRWAQAEGEREGYVQVASVNTKSTLTLPDDDGDPEGQPEKFDGWYITLDAARIDKLIKTLHKAKRQAFPPNEVTPASKCPEVCDHAPDGGDHPEVVL